MNRYLLTLISLAGVLFWLVFSYLSPSVFALPQVNLQGMLPGRLLQALAVLSLIVFLIVQLRILWATYRMKGLVQADAGVAGRRFRLGAEFFWTALPLVMTAALAYWSWPVWRNLSP